MAGKGMAEEPISTRNIYWIDVIERAENSLEDIKVIMSYPFPDVPIEPFGFHLLNFELQLEKVEDRFLREGYKTRFCFIKDRWHPKNFLRVVIKNWKYGYR